jgi:putative transposase
MIDSSHPALSVKRQCELLGLNRSTYYLEPAGETAENLELMRRIDELYTERPFYGSRRLLVVLNAEGYRVNRKRVQRLMRLMGLEAVYPKPRLSQADKEHKKYPYLLRGLAIIAPDQVWAADITYIRMVNGFMYLFAIIDWCSRRVLSWRLSNSLDVRFCIEALEEALQRARPLIFNTDQGVQFTSAEFTEQLIGAGIEISMDGRGRALDNVYIERLWRSLKYEDIYLKEYETVEDLRNGLTKYFAYYNNERPHQGLDYRTPEEVYV